MRYCLQLFLACEVSNRTALCLRGSYAMVITVDDLIKTPFRDRTPAEKVRIVKEGKPIPGLFSERKQNVGSSSNNTRIVATVFQDTMYDKMDWLTACCKRKSLFCWPCLLFRYERNLLSQWHTIGCKVSKRLPGSLEAHQNSIAHLQSVLDMQNFRQNLEPQNYLQSVLHMQNVRQQYAYQNPPILPELNDLVQRNRDIMRRIIDVICVLITQQRPPRVGSKDRLVLRLKECLENLAFLRDYDTQGRTIIEDATEVLQISPSIMTDIVDALTNLVKRSIQKETQSSTFVSLILNQHSSNDTQCQISSALRYLKNDKVCERFVGFTTINVNKSSNIEVLRHLVNVADLYKIQPKLIAITFDGAVLQSKHKINEFLKKLHYFFPPAIFVPCYLHKFDDVLQQCLTVYKDCDFFFKTSKAIGSFIYEDAKIRQHFENFIHSKVPNSESLDFVNYAVFFNSMKTLRRHLIEYFDCKYWTCEYWKVDDLTQILGFQRFLAETMTIFLLELFSMLFTLTNDISAILNSGKAEIIFENNLIDNVLQILEFERETGFEKLWKNVNFEIEEGGRAMLEVGNSTQDFYRALFMNCINCTRIQIQIRSIHSKELEFFHLLDPAKCRKGIRICDCVCKLKELYGSIFDMPEMLKELKVLYANPDLIADKSAYELLEFFIEADLKAIFQNVYKLVEIILTMPYKPPSLNNTTSKLDKINAWSYSLDKKLITGDLALLCVELDYFLQLRRGHAFYDEVILEFQERNYALDLLSYQ